MAFLRCSAILFFYLLSWWDPIECDLARLPLAGPNNSHVGPERDRSAGQRSGFTGWKVQTGS